MLLIFFFNLRNNLLRYYYMDINKWKNNINNLSINDNLKNNIISFFQYFGHNDSFSFIKITDQKIINAFNNINNYKQLSICFDVEFQSALSTKKNIVYDDNGKIVYIREIGLMFFVHYENFIYYIGHIFLNFKSLDKFDGFHKKDIRLITSKYATVTNVTHELMSEYEDVFHIDTILDPLDQLDKNNFINDGKYKRIVNDISKELFQNYLFKKKLDQKTKDNIKISFGYLLKAETIEQVQIEIKYIKRQLNNIQYEIYAKDLEGSNLLKNFNKIHELYWNDKLVIERLKLIEGKYEEFMQLFNLLSKDAILVVKGKMDLIAMKNTANIINPKITMNINKLYDIETFNGFSKMHFGSSQLENTYRSLIETNIYKGSVKMIFTKIGKSIGEKAHNPVVDSFFTIVVAVIINIGLNECFWDKFSGGEIKSYYYIKYVKYKHEYLRSKNLI